MRTILRPRAFSRAPARAHFTPPGSRPDVDPHRSSRERRALGTRCFREVRAGRRSGSTGPGPARANRIRSVKGPRAPAACASLAALALAWVFSGAASPAEGAGPRVAFETTHGVFVLELDWSSAPETVANFLRYVRAGHYRGTIFHRVIAGFMIQGGGFTEGYRQQPTGAPVRNEADRAGPNDRGTIAMARTNDPHSATAQFFINVADNDFLDHRAPTRRGWGYTVFGRVVEGMETVDGIAALPTGPGGPFRQDVPREAVVIRDARVHPAG